jgi:ATP-dependent Clp protease ATP-binding subunit ClpC
MTSNIGAEKLQKEASLGFSAVDEKDREDLEKLHQANKDKVQDELKKLMRPELINRIDKIIVFHALTKKDILKILDLQVKELQDRLIKHGISIKLTPKAKQYMLDKGYDALNGVRPLRRLIQDTLEDHIAAELLHETYKKGDILEVGARKQKLDYAVISE